MELLEKYDIHTVEKASSKCLIYLHSFDYGTVKYWGNHTELPNHYLASKGDKFNLTDVNLYATGVGFNDGLLWDSVKSEPSQIFHEARDMGLMVHMWTFKDDALYFKSKNNIVVFELFRKCITLLIILSN